MSLDATKWAWEQSGIKASDKLVLLSLADRANEYHECYPSISRLSDDTCLNRKTVMTAISRMEKDGILSIKKDDGSVNFYKLLGVKNRHETGGKPVPKTVRESSTKNGTGTKNGTSTKTGTAPVPKTVRHQYQNRDTNLPRTYQEPTKKKKVPKKKAWILPEKINEKAWLEFEQHRREMKQPLSDLARTKAANILIDHSLDAQQGMVDQTIQNRWKGLFPLKPEKSYETNQRNPANLSAVGRTRAAANRRAAERGEPPVFDEHGKIISYSEADGQAFRPAVVATQ